MYVVALTQSLAVHCMQVITYGTIAIIMYNNIIILPIIQETSKSKKTHGHHFVYGLLTQEKYIYRICSNIGATLI